MTQFRLTLVTACFAALTAAVPDGARAQSGAATPFPNDAMFDGLVEIYVGNELRGTGILMDDDAQTVVTAKSIVEDGNILGVSVRMDGEEFFRKADIVATERNYGLAMLWVVGTPSPKIRTGRPAMLPRSGDTLTLIGCFCVLFNEHRVCKETGVGYGDVTVLRPDSGILPHPYGPPTTGLMIVALPHETPVPLSGGMAVFSPTDGRLVGIVARAYEDQLIVVPVSTVNAMLRSAAMAQKRK